MLRKQVTDKNESYLRQVNKTLLLVSIKELNIHTFRLPEKEFPFLLLSQQIKSSILFKNC